LRRSEWTGSTLSMTEARSTSTARSNWRSWWSGWRAKGAVDKPATSGRTAQPAMMLVASFDSLQETRQASAALQQSGFEIKDAALIGVTVSRKPPARCARILSRVVDRWRKPATASSGNEVETARLRKWLASGRGILVVHPGGRLHQACELIEAAGGLPGFR
jgi:hypothetical protein